MEQILPLVKKYDAAVIALPNDEEEIPMEPEKRLELVDKIVRVATEEYGIALDDIVIDPLAMPIGADVTTAFNTMETMRGVRDKHGLNMTCGGSNVSFGMPGRHVINGTFLPMAMTAGLTSAIMDARTPLGRRVGARRRPADGQRRVGHGLDRGPPRQGQRLAVTCRGSRHPLAGARGARPPAPAGGRAASRASGSRVETPGPTNRLDP